MELSEEGKSLRDRKVGKAGDVVSEVSQTKAMHISYFAKIVHKTSRVAGTFEAE